MSWQVGLALHDAGVAPSPADLAAGIDTLGAAGARIVNLSWGLAWRRQPLAADSMSIYQLLHNEIMPAIRRMRAGNRLPFIVVAAGNGWVDTTTGISHGMNAKYSLFPMIRDSVPGLSVGAIGPSHQIATFSDSGPHVDVYAPGDSVYSLKNRGGVQTVVRISGTSFAAPFVSGIAALLESFDSRLRTATDTAFADTVRQL